MFIPLVIINRHLQSVISVLLFVIILCFISCDDDTVIIVPISPPHSDHSTIDYIPAWSPDGHTIAYCHYDSISSNSGIYLIDTNGTKKRKLTGEYTGCPDFSPDGNWITFCSENIFKVKINGDSLMQLSNSRFAVGPSWSPNGDWIVYAGNINDTSNYSGIWKVKPDTTERRLVGWDYSADWSMPNWSNDGKIIVFLKYFPGSGWEKEIVTMDSSGNNFFRITYNTFTELYPRYSPDGGKIIFTMTLEPTVNTHVCTINTDGSGFTVLTDTCGFSADYSPDGESIVYSNYKNGSRSLWIMNKDGTNKRQLTFP
jgi:TolB protein